VYHIPRHQLTGIDAALFAIAQHRGFGGNGPRQGGQSGLCLALLCKTNGSVDDYHAKDHPGIQPLAEKGCDGPGSYQHQHQGLAELGCKTQQGAAPGAGAGFIGSVTVEAFQSLGVS